MLRSMVTLVALLVPLVAAAACGDDPVRPEPRDRSALEVALVRDSLVFGDSVAAVVTVLRNRRGGDIPSNAIAGAVTWESSDTTVATVDSAGLIRSTGDGRATITARYGRHRWTREVTVALHRLPTDVRFAKLSLGWTHACGLTAAGEVYCWGTLLNLGY
jgi:hypothetical protein